MKVHHCIADGIAATNMLARLCDDGGGGTFATEICPAHEPARSGLRLPALTLNPIDWIAGAWRTSLGVTTAAAQALQGAADIAGGLLRPAAASSLTGPVTTMRRYATVEVSLEDVARVCDRFEVTINDVALAAITDSFRTMLIRRGEQPQRNSLPPSCRCRCGLTMPPTRPTIASQSCFRTFPSRRPTPFSSCEPCTPD